MDQCTRTGPALGTRTRPCPPQRDDSPRRRSARALGWVSAEAVVGLCVIVATTALAATRPARTPSTAVARESTSTTVSLEADVDTGEPRGEGSADIVSDPGRRGPDAAHVTLTAQDGTPLDAPEIQASLTSRSGSIRLLPVPVERVSAGH